MNKGPRSFNEAANAWKEKPNFNWAHAQTFTSPQNGSFSTYSSCYQIKLEKALTDFDSHQERRLSSLSAQLGQQQDDMISKINLLSKAISEKLDNMATRNTAGNPTPQLNYASIDYPTQKKNFEAPGDTKKEDKAKESMKSSATKYKDHEMTVESKEEFEEETEEETEEEEEEDNPKHSTFTPITMNRGGGGENKVITRWLI
ncbi:hypothetical protein Tco_0654757 [Tanacetum coccineum]|uniref:Uncharacterized protein n=1 Tax=Tanacetum coccineum TaxID=301880 RepID=A0ABQ4X4J0_9ASTR